MVDESSGRVLRRVLGRESGKPAYSDRSLLCATGELVSLKGCEAFNLGLIDIAARFCRPKTPLCQQCPLNESCSYGQVFMVKVSQSAATG